VKFLNAQPQEIVFTSGATEANNMAIRGVIQNYYFNNYKQKPHVITTKLEHQSVYNLVKDLEKKGIVETTYIQPDKEGHINTPDVLGAFRENTILVSIIFVSNEIGSVLPVREIGSIIKSHNPHIMYHVDAVQAANFYNLNVEKINCDLLTLSAHKISGPKGIGALYVKTGVKLDKLVEGGSQEYGRRPGTQNTSGIIGFAKAIELLGPLEARQKNSDKISKLRDKLIKNILSINGVELNGPMGDDRVANNVNFTIYEVDQDALMTALDLAGIAASTGSACVSGSSTPSHVIEALGKANNRLAATVRFTLGSGTTQAELGYTVKCLVQIVTRLRQK
jgi:cysteine desulfurase